jgi:hypothetical protein
MFAEQYLLPDMKEQIRLAWQGEGYIQLDHVLDVQTYLKLGKLAWGKGKQVERADRFSYGLVSPSALHKAFSTEPFTSWVGSLLGGNVKKSDVKVMQYGWKDFTLLHDSDNMEGVATFFFIFAGIWDPSWGGTLHLHREKHPALEVGLKGNRLFLVRSRDDWRPFIQYVNHLAGKETFVIVQGTVS